MPDKTGIFASSVPWLRLYLPWLHVLGRRLFFPPLSLFLFPSWKVGTPRNKRIENSDPRYDRPLHDRRRIAEAFVLMATCLSGIPLKPPRCPLNLINGAFALRRIHHHYVYKLTSHRGWRSRDAHARAHARATAQHPSYWLSRYYPPHFNYLVDRHGCVNR